MTDSTNNVIRFEQPGSYWQQKARLSRRSLRYPDAALLLRKAFHQAGGDDQIALELAETYTDMQCFLSSDRLLYELLSGDPQRPVCYYLMACNAMGQGHYLRASGALAAYLHFEPEGVYAERAKEMLYDLPQSPEPMRGGARSRVMMRRATKQFYQNDQAGALCSAERAYTLQKNEQSAMLYSTLLLCKGKIDEALRAARMAVIASNASFVSLILFADTLCAAKKYKACHDVLSCAARKCEEAHEYDVLCLCAHETHNDDVAVPVLEKRLKEAPHSADLMYSLAVALYKIGKKNRAGAVLDRIREIDPEDDIAAYYATHPKEAPDITRQLPEKEVSRRVARVVKAAAREEGFPEVYHKDKTLRRDLFVLFTQGQPKGQIFALSLLQQAGDEHALRKALLYPIAKEARTLALEILRGMGSPMPYLMLMGETVCFAADEKTRVPQPQEKAPDDGLRSLTHMLILWLHDMVKPQVTAHFIAPIWHKLPRAAREHCRSQSDAVWPSAFALFILHRTGAKNDMAEKLLQTPDRRRILRALKQIEAIDKRRVQA